MDVRLPYYRKRKKARRIAAGKNQPWGCWMTGDCNDRMCRSYDTGQPAIGRQEISMSATCCRLASRKAFYPRHKCRCRRPMRQTSPFPMRVCLDRPTSRPKTFLRSRNSSLRSCAIRTCGRPNRRAARCFPMRRMCLMWSSSFRHCPSWGKPMRRRKMNLPCLLRLQCFGQRPGRLRGLRQEWPREACDAECGFLA